MSLFARSVSTLWVLMLLLSSANNAMAVVRVTNSLDGNLDLTIYCNNIDPLPHRIRPGTSYELNYSGGSQPGKPPFFCFFQWQGAFHSFDMCVPRQGGGCQQCNWLIKQAGPCRYEGTHYICASWK
ncbi:Plant self-incompatibility S1 [Spatholobus suberectus]|nr:Plant self-incompatibility S1 [Spatholobus suberectus]